MKPADSQPDSIAGELVSRCYEELVRALNVDGRYAQPPGSLSIEKKFMDRYAKNAGRLQGLEKKISQLESRKPGKKLDRMKTELELKYTRKIMGFGKKSAEHFMASVSDAAYRECYKALRTAMHGCASEDERKIEDALSDLAASVFADTGRARLIGTIYSYASDQELRAGEIGRMKAEEKIELYRLMDQVGASVPHNYRSRTNARASLVEGRALGYLAALGMEAMSKGERTRELETLLKESDRGKVLKKLEAFGKKGAEIYADNKAGSKNGLFAFRAVTGTTR